MIPGERDDMDPAKGIARIIDPDAFTINSGGLTVRREEALSKANAILSAYPLRDEAAIRAEEREKCAQQFVAPVSGLELHRFIFSGRAATDTQGNELFIAKPDVERLMNDRAAAIREGATIAAGHVSIPNDILMQARCPSDARQTIGECSNCGCSIGLYAIRNGGQK